tara:strand:- start:770 stop:1099 length:330 start_codon:yes stop_codon:yes gene_type:complete
MLTIAITLFFIVYIAVARQVAQGVWWMQNACFLMPNEERTPEQHVRLKKVAIALGIISSPISCSIGVVLNGYTAEVFIAGLFITTLTVMTTQVAHDVYLFFSSRRINHG